MVDDETGDVVGLLLEGGAPPGLGLADPEQAEARTDTRRHNIPTRAEALNTFAPLGRLQRSRGAAILRRIAVGKFWPHDRLSTESAERGGA